MYLVIDCETTGLPKDSRAPVTDAGNWPRVVQVAWILCDESGRPIESTSCLVRPDGFTIPVDAQRIHRHRREGLKEYPTRTIFIDPLLAALGWDVRPGEDSPPGRGDNGRNGDAPCAGRRFHSQPQLIRPIRTRCGPIGR